MRTTLLLIPLLFLAACSTTAMPQSARGQDRSNGDTTFTATALELQPTDLPSNTVMTGRAGVPVMTGKAGGPVTLRRR